MSQPCLVRHDILRPFMWKQGRRRSVSAANAVRLRVGSAAQWSMRLQLTEIVRNCARLKSWRANWFLPGPQGNQGHPMPDDACGRATENLDGPGPWGRKGPLVRSWSNTPQNQETRSGLLAFSVLRWRHSCWPLGPRKTALPIVPTLERLAVIERCGKPHQPSRFSSPCHVEVPSPAGLPNVPPSALQPFSLLSTRISAARGRSCYYLSRRPSPRAPSFTTATKSSSFPNKRLVRVWQRPPSVSVFLTCAVAASVC